MLFLASFIYVINKIIHKYNDLAPKTLSSGDLIVSNVDLYKYKGIWYEIARLPNYFEGKDCINPIAIYDLNDDNTMSIKNQCGINNNISVKGTAYPIYPNLPLTNPQGKPSSNQIGRFKVYFENIPIPGEYNIIYLDSNYQYAMVGTTDRKMLWLLSRSTNVNALQIKNMLAFAKVYGYPIDKLIQSTSIIMYSNEK